VYPHISGKASTIQGVKEKKAFAICFLETHGLVQQFILNATPWLVSA